MQSRITNHESRIRRVTVIGAGTMGHGIAQVAAVAGYLTHVTDANPEAIVSGRNRIQANLGGAVARGKLTQAAADAALSRVTGVPGVEDAARDADLVIEAILEDLVLKQSLFQQLDSVVGDDTILATNTSSLSVTRIAEATSRPARVVGMHFFNPVHIMKLVELIAHDSADPAVLDAVRAVAVKMGKTPILVRDSPGFASSRLGVILGLEAMRMLEEGVASAVDIDTAMELGYGHPMGPLRVSDVVGLDVRLKIADYLHQAFGEQKFEAPRILRDKVTRGELGKKTGRGFFDW
jgi:3-hydroxybutyryl-CoA dehydrogenase